MALLGFSCNPAKEVLKQQQYNAALKAAFDAEKQSIAAEAVAGFVKNNPCQPVPEINLDSLCSIYYQCPSAAQVNTANELAPENKNVQYKIHNIMVPWQDTRAIKLLSDSIIEKDKRLAVVKAQLLAKDNEIIAAVQNANIEAGKKKNSWLQWFLIGIVIAETIIITLFIIRK